MKKFVYVFKVSGTSFFKIGYTESSVSSRFNSFKTYVPQGGEIFCVIKSSKPRDLEKELHNKFKNKRMNGEFFNLDEVDLSYLKSLVDKDTVYLNNLFWELISKRDLTIEDLKNIFKEDSLKDSHFDLLEQKVCEFINNNLRGSILSNTEILNNIKENMEIDLSQRMLGSVLRKNYSQQVKKIKGVSSRVYQL